MTTLVPRERLKMVTELLLAQTAPTRRTAESLARNRNERLFRRFRIINQSLGVPQSQHCKVSHESPLSGLLIKSQNRIDQINQIFPACARSAPLLNYNILFCLCQEEFFKSPE